MLLYTIRSNNTNASKKSAKKNRRLAYAAILQIKISMRITGLELYRDLK